MLINILSKCTISYFFNILNNNKYILKLAIFVLGIFLPLEVATGANYYVRSNATGAGTGSDWVNAFEQLPNQLERGSTYYMADGTYNGYLFNDDEIGNEIIHIKKATILDHGSDLGWDDEFGNGVAEWRVNLLSGNYNCGWVFLRGYYDIDGTIGGGPNSWGSGHGFTMTNREPNTIFIMFSDKFGIWGQRPDISNIKISHLAVEGELQPGYGQGIQANAYQTTVTDIHLSHLYFYNIGGGHIDLRANPANWLIEYSYFHGTSTSTDHHGVGIRMDNLLGPFVYRYNRMANMVGTGWIGHYSGAPNSGDGAEFYGNVFFCTADQTSMTGWAPIFSDSVGGSPVVDNWKIYNNTFAGFPNHGKIVELDTPNSSNIQVYNNLAFDLGGPTRVVNVDDPQLVITATNNPFRDYVNYDFTPSSGIESGVQLSEIYRSDALGNLRGEDGTWDVGAIELTESSGQVPSLPRNMRVYK